MFFNNCFLFLLLFLSYLCINAIIQANEINNELKVIKHNPKIPKQHLHHTSITNDYSLEIIRYNITKKNKRHTRNHNASSNIDIYINSFTIPNYILLRNPKPFYYIPDGQGIITQLRRADVLWNIANTYHRLLYHADFITGHFNSIPVSLCDIFNMPKNFTCIHDSYQYLFQNKSCIIGTIDRTIDKYKDFPRNFSIHMSIDINFFEENCIAGAFRPIQNKTGVFPFHYRFPILRESKTIFTRKYYQYLPRLRKLIGIRSYEDEYNVIHWRRDDQLKYRCGTLDKSINCADSVQEFTDKINTSLNVFTSPNGNIHKRITYISTDEKRKEQLEYLHKQQFKLFSVDIQPYIEYLFTNNKFTNYKRDIFILELLLMFDSNYFLAWGHSSIHKFVCEYRLLHVLSKKKSIYMTIINDQLISHVDDCKNHFIPRNN